MFRFICKDNLDNECKCTICGKVCHDLKQDDDGSFAASGKVDTIRCVRCGKYEKFYSDTRTLIYSDFEVIPESKEDIKRYDEDECNHDYEEYDE